MEIRPILSSLLRNKTGALLIAAQVALSLAIVANALYIIQDRIARTARPAAWRREHADPLRRGADQGPGNARGQARAAGTRRGGVCAASRRGLGGDDQPAAAVHLRLEHGPVARGRQKESSAEHGAVLRPRFAGEDLQLKLVEGRDLTPRTSKSPIRTRPRAWAQSALVTQALAKKLFPDGSAVGKTVYIGGEQDLYIQIVGVVEKLQSPWAQSGERGELSTILANRRVDTYLHFGDARRAGPARPRDEGRRGRDHQDPGRDDDHAPRAWTRTATTCTATTAPSPGCSPP
jgi:putative ABC transport system permease protein